MSPVRKPWFWMSRMGSKGFGRKRGVLKAFCARKRRSEWKGLGEGKIKKGPRGDWTWKDVQRKTKFEERGLEVCWRENVAASEIAPSFSVSIAGTAEEEPPCRRAEGRHPRAWSAPL